MARIHPFVQQVHRLALARAVEAADEDQQREFGLFEQPVLRLQERLAQRGLLAAVARLADAMSYFSRFEHAHLHG
jgi:hypothetical protein